LQARKNAVGLCAEPFSKHISSEIIKRNKRYGIIFVIRCC